MPPEQRNTVATVNRAGQTVAESHVWRDTDFRGPVDFREARFPAGGDFRGAVFEETADFRGAVFEDRVDFAGAVFRKGAIFSNAVFHGRVWFRDARIEADANFRGATFEKFLVLENATVGGDLLFVGADFQLGASFEQVTVEGDLELNRATFGVTTSLIGPLTAGQVFLRLTTFARRVRLELNTGALDIERAVFGGGVQFLLGGAPWVKLVDSALGPASLIAIDPNDHAGRPPRVLTLSGTDLSNLTVGTVDLSACKFTVAHNVERLRLDYDYAFGWTPRNFWISRRRITGDEQRWRATYGPKRSRERWTPPADWRRRRPPGTPGEVAKVYRSLRRSREDARDEPGAADFYYGEMEMRRLGKLYEARRRFQVRNWRGWLASSGEHALLWLYWLCSGYGLRAWRSFTGLTAVLLLAAGAFTAWGYPPKKGHDYWYSLQFSLRAATSFFRGTDQVLSTAGGWIELVLRLIGPLLFGLAVLALRGRVKR